MNKEEITKGRDKMNFMKKAAFAAITLSAAAMLFCCSVFADGVNCGRIAYFDESGNQITSFAGGDTVVAKIKTKSSEPKKMMLALLLYENDKLTACGLDSKQTGGGVTEYSAKLTVPSDAKAPEINAIMWDSLSDMNPICASSTFGSSDAAVTSISVNGVPIENFDPEKTEYSISLPANTVKTPLVKAETSDGAARIEITNPTAFPGKSVVKTVAQNGTPGDKEYTINYVCGDKLVENIDFPNEVVKKVYNGRYTYFDAVTQNFTPYFDRGAVTVLSDELLGKPYIQGSLGQYSENESPYEIREVWYDPEAIWLTFDLRRPAVIEVYSEKDLTKSKWKDIATKSTLDGGAPYFGWGWQCKVKYSMKADTGKVEIPTLCVDNGMALTFVFDGYTEPADVNELEF